MVEAVHHREFLECLRRADLTGGGEIGGLFTWHWTPGWAEQLEAIGVLEAAGEAEWWLCDRCNAVSARVERRYVDERGVLMAKTCCRERGYHLDTVECAELRQWTVSLTGVAMLLAEAAGLRSEVHVVDRGRLVILGTTSVLGPPATLCLARGLLWDNGRDVVERCVELAHAESPILVSLGDAPAADQWPEPLPPVVPFASAVTLRSGRLEFDRDRLSSVAWRLSPRWLTQQAAVDLLAKDLGRRDRKRLTALVSTAGARREFRTNGGTGREKLIDAVSFAAWRLRKRDEALDRADAC